MGQLSPILTDADGNQGTVSTTLYGFTPTNAVIVGTKGTIRFDGPFHLPGSFAVVSADGSRRLRYEEYSGGHFEGLYYEAAEVARASSPVRWRRGIAPPMIRSKPWRPST